MKNNAHAITQADIQRLRGAIFIVASTEQGNSRLESYDLIAIPEGGDPSGVLNCDHSATMHRPEVGFVSASVQVNGNSPLWKTMTAILEPGDRINLHWIADNQSRLTEAHGVGLDELHIEVSRPGTVMAQPFTFAVAHRSFAADGNPVDRMIQTAPLPGPGRRKIA